METSNLAVVFTGQGKLDAAGFAASRHVLPHARQVFSEIDAVSFGSLGVKISDLLEKSRSRGDSASMTHAALQLAQFGASVAIYKYCFSRGVRPGAVIGHSFGEIAALVSAGALSVRDGAFVVCERIRVLESLNPRQGAMGVLNTDAASAQAILDELASDSLDIAVENAPDETLIAGAVEAVVSAFAIASRKGVRFSRLVSPYAMHCPSLMTEAAGTLLHRLSGLRPRVPEAPVYSPYMARFLTENDDLADMLAFHFYRRLPFAQAVRRLYQSGISAFVECNVLSGFDRQIKSTIKDCEVIHVDMSPASRSKLDKCVERSAVSACRSSSSDFWSLHAEGGSRWQQISLA